MSCPAVEHGKAVAKSNADRLQCLFDEIRAAGVFAQLLEVLEINGKPEAAYSGRMQQRG